MAHPIRVPIAVEQVSPGLTLENFRKNYATCRASLDRQVIVRQTCFAISPK
jgi:hypothetical protein